MTADDEEEEEEDDNGVMSIFNQVKQEKELREKRNKLRDQDLQTNNEKESAYKRVRAEAIDFDWIFKGSEKNDNAKNMILLLSAQDRSELFITRSIRVFIELMWQQY